MDKRSVIFFVSLAITLFCVNLFFQWINHEEVAKWHLQQQALVEKQQSELSQELEELTAKPQNLPLVEIFSDEAGKNRIASGVKADEMIVTLSWSKELPKIVYYRPFGTTESLKKIEGAFLPDQIGELVVYRLSSDAKLSLPTLPTFGHFDLQLLVPSSDQILLGQYVDGNLVIPYEKLLKLRQEKSKPVGNALALLKVGNQYLPVAVYASDTKSLVHIERIPTIQDLIIRQQIEKSGAGPKSTEKFYVLENEYQQLVFSNFGGALSEINLPFQSEKNERSVVKEIAFDREIVQDHPYNAYFPQHPFYIPGDDQEKPQGKLGGYYPLIRRDLIESSNRQSIRVTPNFYALNFVSEYPELSNLVYEVTSFTEDTIVFEAAQTHRKITKKYSVANQKKGAPYCIDLEIKIEGDSRGFWLSSGIPEVEMISGSPAPSMKYRIVRGKKSEVNEITLPKESMTVTTVNPSWIETSNGFFGIILDPLTKIEPGYKVQFVSGATVPSRLIEIDQEYDVYKPQSMPGYMAMLPLKSANGTMKFRIFAGPYSEKILSTVDQTFTDKATGYNPQYTAVQSFHGWFAFISEPFARFLWILMRFFHQVTGSWGFSIILLTVALRIMLYPLNAWQAKSMLKMQEIAPKQQALQEKYKNDPKKLQLEMLKLMRETGANPLSGCFPLLIQIPFLMGMFGLLRTSFALRGASFIPGWITDLSAPDVLFSWERPIFFFGTSFHLLPFILGAVMFVQQRFMSSGPKDVNQMTEQQRQAKVMGNMMAVVFTVMFYHFPSGLNIYWLSSMLLGILQQWWTKERMEAKKEAVVKAKPVATGKQKKS